MPLPPPYAIDVGDPLPVTVGLHYPDRTVPPNAEITVTITGPRISIGKLVAAHGLVAPPGGPDPVNAWTATLQQIAAANGGTLPVPTFTRTVNLFDDGAHNDGAMEPDGVFAVTIPGITKVEGTYDFHAVARYGSDCPATRETFWSLTVGLKDDPYRHVVKRDRSSDNKPDPRAQVKTSAKMAKTSAKAASARTKRRRRPR